MIRFNGPSCGKKFKVSDGGAGKRFTCSRCGHLSTAAADGDSGSGVAQLVEGRHVDGAGRAGGQDLGGAAGLIADMSRGVRWAVIASAGLCALCLLVAILARLLPVDGGLLDTASGWAVPLFLCSAVILMAIIHGQATSCPTCRKWWVRERVESEFVDRTVVRRGRAGREVHLPDHLRVPLLPAPLVDGGRG